MLNRIDAAWRAAWVLTLVYAIAFVHRIGLGFHAEPIKRALGLTDTQIGVLSGIAFALPYALGGLVAGWLTDRINRTRLLLGATLLWSAATSALGLAAGYGALVLARIVTGIGQSPVQPASASLLADLFEPERRGRAYGLLIAATALGTAAAFGLGALSVVGGRLLGQHLALEPWRAGLLLLGAIGGLGALALGLLREPPRREMALGHPAAPRDVLRLCAPNAAVLAALFLGVTLAFMAPYGQLAFMAPLFARKYGWSADELALVYGVVAIAAGAGGSLLGGWLLDRRRRSSGTDAAWWLCLWGSFWSLLPGALAPMAPSGELALAAFTIAAVFSNWPAIGVLAVITDLAPNEIRGQVTAVHTALVGILAAGLGPVSLGVITDRFFGTDAAVDRSMALLFAMCAIGSTVLLWAGRRRAMRRGPG